MNNGKSDETALLAGCKGKPEEYVKRGQERSSFLGKQLANAYPKQGKTIDTYFEKKHNWISDGDKFTDRIRYKELQTEKKKGFLTSDFSKRDEFSNTVRTLQYRELLDQEAKFTKKAIELLGDSGPQLPPPEPREETLLYDLVFDKDLTTADGASKTHRDTRNRTALSHDRHMGGALTSSLIAFQPPTEFSKPEFANKPLIQSTFYRKTNVFFPPGVCAEPTA